MSEEQENAMIKQAQDYNESLIGIGSIADPFSESNENQTEDDEYNKLLKIDDTGMMGYIDIQSLMLFFRFIMEHPKKYCSQV